MFAVAAEGLSMYVCICKAVTDAQITDAVEQGVQDLNQLADHCGAGTGCGRCQDTARELIEQHRAVDITCAA